MSENKPIIIDFPINLLRYELKEFLEYNFKVYIKKDVTDIMVYGNPSDLALCQEQANYFKSVDSQFLLHLNEYGIEALNIPNLKLYYQTKCRILMRVESNILYIFGQLYNTTCVYNYLCHYINLIEKEIDFDFNDNKETDLNLMCRELNIKLPSSILSKTKILVYYILKHRLELFKQLDSQNELEFNELPFLLENSNITVNHNEIKEPILESKKAPIEPENDLRCLLQPEYDPSELYRTIIIDGNNLAYQHGLGSFSPMGIKIAVDYFVSRGHQKVYAIIPRHCQHLGGSVFEELKYSCHLKYTPSRVINNVRETPHIDRIILDAAVETDGIIVSNYQFREYIDVDKYKDVIYNRLLAFTFVDDHIIIPNNPLGRNGPILSDMLKYPDRVNKKSPKKNVNQFRQKPRQPTNNPKVGGATSFHQHRPYKSDLNGPQLNLYRQAHSVFPNDGSIIKSVILGNPEITDLNTIINFVMMAKKSK